MNRKAYIYATACLLTIFSTQFSLAEPYDSNNFSADGRKFQPVPTGHTPGKDNGPGLGTHNAGEDCGICHKPNGKAASHVFTMSGTLYSDRAARKPLKGGEVILQDINGKVISMTSNDAGNFWTYTAIGSNPYTVVGKGVGLRLYTTDQSGFHPADPKYPQSWQYKAWVKNGDHVLPMVTIAPVGGATILSDGKPDTSSRMSCNMHHAPMGSRGGLWAGKKSTLASYPSSGLSFKKHILPIFRSKCAPCHIPGETWTRIVTKSDIEGSALTKIDYSKSVDLTSHSGSTVTVSGTTWTKKGVSDQAVRDLILPKTDGTVTHAGGKFWSAGDPDYEAIKQWIAEGAKNN